ncbi:ABC transporter thiamine pyrophosphate-binding lipoprotein p37/Cypl [Metamycoplasma canadense]|nr:alkylphosphonate ABC transporter substrate-binidng protein [Metamycoplasma canadense]
MKKINLFLLSMGTIISIPLTIISCSKKNFNFAVNQLWSGKTDFNFFNLVSKEFNKQRNTSYKPNIKLISENNNIIDLIKKGSSNIAFITTILYMSEYLKNKNTNILPIIQTQTRAFNFDKNFNDRYSDGLENDKLRLIAKKAQDLFEKKPYLDWTDDEYKWNGQIYEYFYANNDELVDFYRGIIMIHGNKQQLAKIKKAWNNKDWNTFRNFGFLTGKKTSGSKYIAQQSLFKKHFNLENNKFTSFEEDKINHSEKYIEGKARDIGKGQFKNFHIVFDELGSFAYTKNKNENKEKKYYTLENSEEKIEFLTVTEAIKYNVLAVNKNAFNSEEIETLKEIIIKLWKDKKDDYGQNVGINGYKKIGNFENEVVEPFLKFFKINNENKKWDS